jgi:hypothetical protein
VNWDDGLNAGEAAKLAVAGIFRVLQGHAKSMVPKPAMDQTIAISVWFSIRVMM